MKKLLASLAVVCIALTSFAQNSAIFENGTNVVNAGIGLGDVYFGSGYSGAPISFNASFDRGVTSKLGIGYIGAGGVVNYLSRSYNLGNGYKEKISALLIGARATYHFALNGDIAEKFDPYAGVVLGYVITSSSITPSGYAYGTSKSSSLGTGVFAGAHYYFIPNFGVYAELGYNVISVLNTGITIKF